MSPKITDFGMFSLFCENDLSISIASCERDMIIIRSAVAPFGSGQAIAVATSTFVGVPDDPWDPNFTGEKKKVIFTVTQ